MIWILFYLGGLFIALIIGFCIGCSWIFKRNFQLTKEQCKRGDKFLRMFGVLNHWMQLREEHKDTIHFLKTNGYNHIAIYGVGHLGKHLIKELDKSEIHIDYLIDRKVEEVKENIKIYKPEDTLPETDAIVVTVIMEFDEIADMLEKKVRCQLLSLEDVIYGVD